jgi:hypothetical protein
METVFSYTSQNVLLDWSLSLMRTDKEKPKMETTQS